MGLVLSFPLERRTAPAKPASRRPPSAPERAFAVGERQMRSIERDIAHLDRMSGRARDICTLSRTIATATGATHTDAQRAARAIALYVTTGRER